MKKRIISLLLCLILLMGVLPLSAFAAAAPIVNIEIDVTKYVEGVSDKDAVFLFEIGGLADGIQIDTSNDAMSVEVLAGESYARGTIYFTLISNNFDVLAAQLAGGFTISEKDTGLEGWTYSDASWLAVARDNYNGSQNTLTTYDFAYYDASQISEVAYVSPTAVTLPGVSMNQEVFTGSYSREPEFTNIYEAPQQTLKMTIPVPFTKVVEVEGNGTAPRQSFRFDVTAFGTQAAEDMIAAIDGAVVETNGAGTYEGCLYLYLEMDSIYDLGNLEEGFVLYEIPDEADNWTFAETAWYVMPYFEIPEDGSSRVRFNYSFYALDAVDGFGDYYDGPAQREAVFTNTYTVQGPVTFEFPYTKAVLQAGTQPSGNQSFTLELSDFGAPMEGMTVEGTAIETVGPGTYNGVIKVTVPQEMVGNLSEGFCVTEKNTGLAGWTYSDSVWFCRLVEEEVNTSLTTSETETVWVPEIYNVTDGNDPFIVEAEESMLFINTFTKDIEVVEDRDFILHYESNGGTEYPDEVYAPNTMVPMTKYPFREGYTFTGWYADAALTTKITSVLMDSDKTVYAGWSRTPVPKYLNGDDHFAYVIGYEDGTTRPLNNITRAEVAMIFFRLLKLEYRIKYETDVNSFTDVNVGDWYNTAVSTLASMGILNGRTATSFAPNANITRAEFAAICARCDESVATGVECFNDLDGHWAKAEVEKAAFLGWIKGYADGSFQPNKNITRAEAFTLINRVLQRIPGSVSDLLPEMAHWPDNADTSAWYYIAVQEATCSHEYQDKGDGHERWVRLVDNVF